jgi:flavin-dependent dehydrogenase
MSNADYDMVVIGTGTGGEAAAMQATKLNRKVAVVERYMAPQTPIRRMSIDWGSNPMVAAI